MHARDEEDQAPADPAHADPAGAEPAQADPTPADTDLDSAEALYDRAPCSYLTLRPDGVLVRVNQTFLDWTGYAREDLLHVCRFQDLLNVGARIFYETHFAPLLRMQGFVREIAADVVRKDASRIPVLIHATQVLDGRGQPRLVRIMLFDATERRRYERDLLQARREAEQLATIVHETGDAILTMTPDGLVKTWNAGAEAMFGYTAAEMRGRSAATALVPADRLDETRQLWDALRAGEPQHLETVRLHKDGHRIEVSMRVTPHVEPPNELVLVSAILRDVTEQHRVQEQMQRAERLQSVGTLAGGVAHEVNNQMTAVLGFGELALERLGPDHPVAGDVRTMVQSATRAAHITQQLLAFSRRQPLSPRELDLRDLTRELLPVLVHLLGADKSVELVAPAVPPAAANRNVQPGRVRVDPTQIEQILINLTANARDAMETGGQLRIAIDDVRLGDAEARAHPEDDVTPGPYVRLTVTDTGRGMDRVTLGRVFEPFFTTKPVGSGTGLGMSTVHGIVKQHGGQVWVHSELGQGTEVQVYLPNVSPPLVTAAHSQPGQGVARPDGRLAIAPWPTLAGRVGGPPLVLVVEDEDAVRGLVRRVLERAGLEVLEAGTGRQALRVLMDVTQPPALLLTDLIMPELNGRQLADEVTRRWPDLPILYTSAYSWAEMRAQGMLAEGAAFLQKPFVPHELLARVRAVLEGFAETPGA